MSVTDRASLATTSEAVQRAQQHQAEAELKRRLSGHKVPPGLSPRHQEQERCWGWHDERARSKDKYWLDEPEESPSGIAATAQGDLFSIAATKKDTTMPTRDQMFPSKYLKASDLEAGPVTWTISSSEVETLSYQGKENDKVVLSFEESPKLLPLNVTNFDAVCDSTGIYDSDEWVGQKITLYATETEVKGKRFDTVRVRIPKKPTAAPKVKPAPVEMDDSLPDFA
jgi:hypothetical protein